MARQMCKRCNGIYDVDKRGYCVKCNDKNQEEFDKIREYLRRNPDSIVLEIIDKTGVPFKTLNRFVEEGGASYKDSNIKPEDIETGEYLKIIQRLIAGRGKFHSGV